MRQFAVDVGDVRRDKSDSEGSQWTGTSQRYPWLHWWTGCLIGLPHYKLQLHVWRWSRHRAQQELCQTHFLVRRFNIHQHFYSSFIATVSFFALIFFRKKNFMLASRCLLLHCREILRFLSVQASKQRCCVDCFTKPIASNYILHCTCMKRLPDASCRVWERGELPSRLWDGYPAEIWWV